MEYEPKFSNKLEDDEIQAQLDQLEKRALPFRIISIGSVVLIVAFVLSVFLIGPGMFLRGSSMFFLILFLFLLTAVSSIIYNKRNNELKQFISEHITLNLLKSVFDIEVFDYKRYIPEERIKSIGLLRSWNRCDGNNYVKGRYKGYSVEFSYVLLEDVSTTTDADGHTQENVTKIFEGPMLFLSHERTLRAPLILRERQFLLNRGGSNIQTENLAFNKQFQIKCEDGHTAFLLLTPHFMEFITAMDEQAHGTTYLYFDSGVVHIAVHNNSKLFTASANDARDINLLRSKQNKDISYLTDILDEIMRNEYLFKS